jgi:putative DNA primase/helicase
MDNIVEKARGRWPGIFAALGIDVGNGKHKSCPIPDCGGKDRYRFDDVDGTGSWICNQCGAGNGFELVKRCLGVDFAGAVKAVESVIGECKKTPINNGLQYNPDRLREMYKDSKPLDGKCLGSQYLKKRGLSTFPPTLRFLNECYEPSTKTKIPAVLATFSAPDSEALTLHRTYLSPDGTKANLENCKLTMTPKKPMAGGAVRLFPAKDLVGITEGIETAIAVHELYKIPVWAVLSTSLMESFKPPNGMKNIMIYADNDLNFAGLKAAYTLANRLYLKDYAVGVQVPEQAGYDFLNVLISKNH